MTAGKCVKYNPIDTAGGLSTTLVGFICKLKSFLYLLSGIFQTTHKIFWQKSDMKGKTRNKGNFFYHRGAKMGKKIVYRIKPGIRSLGLKKPLQSWEQSKC